MNNHKTPKPKDFSVIVHNPSKNEIYKHESNFLRGDLEKDLNDSLNGGLSPSSQQIVKFHGIYEQDDRDVRVERMENGLEPDYSFMIRLRTPGGLLSALQMKTLIDLGESTEAKSLKLTTRQAVQLHGILKPKLKNTVKGFAKVLLDSIAACGDVNRNVMCSPDPNIGKAQAEIYGYAGKISRHLLPTTNAYSEIWLDGKKTFDSSKVEEPLYGVDYLPRKFKIAIAIPPNNDTDVFANDIGIIAIVKNGLPVGFNVAVGGGLGTTFGDGKTYPRLASVIGYVTKDKIVDVCEKIMTLQRDYGNRSVRNQSRLKYTVDRLGIETFKKLLEERLGYKLEKEISYVFSKRGDEIGWKKNYKSLYSLTVVTEYGRLKDTDSEKWLTALRKISTENLCSFRITGNQNLIFTDVTEKSKIRIDKILSEYGIDIEYPTASTTRLKSLACTALSACPLAMAEAERYLPSLFDKLDPILGKYGLEKEDIHLRMTGCPNGCARPWLGEIAFIGRAPGVYNMYLGASNNGDRLNRLYKENLDENAILEEFEKFVLDYSTNKKKGETSGDFAIRAAYV